jgi:hypothetical protein
MPRIDWRCCGCGAATPNLLRNCDCITECAYDPTNPGRIEVKVEEFTPDHWKMEQSNERVSDHSQRRPRRV